MAAREPKDSRDAVAFGRSGNPPAGARCVAGGSVTLSWGALSGRGMRTPAQVVEIAEDRIVVRVREPIAAGQTVCLLDDGTERKAAVQHCQKEGDGFLAVLHLIARDRRREDRLAACGNGTLYWSDRTGGQVAGVSVRNVTDSGIQIEMHKRLEPLQAVRLCGEAWECQGRILYCHQDGARYVAGIELTRPPYPRNSADYRE